MMIVEKLVLFFFAASKASQLDLQTKTLTRIKPITFEHHVISESMKLSELSNEPTIEPTREPTMEPTCEPSQNPTYEPSNKPTLKPTAPTQGPTIKPTVSPSLQPTTQPTISPTISLQPTISDFPTFSPSIAPTLSIYQTYTIAGYGGTGSASDGDVATSAPLDRAQGLYADTLGNNLYFVDNGNGRTRKIVNGISYIFAGSGGSTYGGDGGPATSASFSSPFGVCGLTSGEIFLSDDSATVVRKVGLDGIISIYAGQFSLNTGGTENGPASAATMTLPRYIFMDTSSHLYIVDYGGNKIRKVDTNSNIISTVVGTGGKASTGDGGQATSATLNTPFGVYVDITGKIFVTEVNGNRVRMVNENGIISRFAGNEGTALTENVPATSSGINSPRGIWGNTVGLIYFLDLTNKVLREISTVTTIINSIAGDPTSTGFISSGLSLSIPITQPRAVYGDYTGRIYYSENNGGQTIRGLYARSMAPTISPTPSPSAEPSTAVPSYSFSPSVSPSASPSVEPSVAPSNAPSITPSVLPSQTPSKLPTATPSTEPSASPSTIQPTSRPTSRPTGRPTSLPSSIPSSQPSIRSTSRPTSTPTSKPSTQPSTQPSSQPSMQPSLQPSTIPSSLPSSRPSSLPTMQPITQPSSQPSALPSSQPSIYPSTQPTMQPSIQPTAQPSLSPSTMPSNQPTIQPSTQPTVQPSSQPSALPSSLPSAQPSSQPSSQPLAHPSIQPSTQPTTQPTTQPLSNPTYQPSTRPSCQPTRIPSCQPSEQPSSSPTMQPSSQSTAQPTLQPSSSPTRQPSAQPSMQPTALPNSQPSSQPSSQPTRQPTAQPTTQPTAQPSSCPSGQPSLQPSTRPSTQPTRHPSTQPSRQPTSQPSNQPTSHPTKLTQSPTIAPTYFTSGSFPNNHSISVMFSAQQLLEGRPFKIVLPFLRVSPTVDGLFMNGFYDVSLIKNETDSSINAFYGSSDLSVMFKTGSKVSSAVLSYDYSSRSVSNAGDINGDGYDDLIIGVPYAARCYVLFGTEQGFVNMTEGFTIFSEQNSLTGWSVSGAGDVNNDTFADILIGAPYAVNNNIGSGAVYVIYGRHSGYRNIPTHSVSIDQGFTIYGAGEGDTLGVSVSSAGDVNGDGVSDIVIGALKSSMLYSGGAYVIFGKKDKQRNSLHLDTLSSQQGFSVFGNSWSYAGYSVSGAGDVNGDGFDDVLIGSVPFRTTFGVQTTYLIYGNTTITNAINLVTLTTQQGVVISGGGVVVSGEGDINHDGCDDIMIVSSYNFPNAGFVVFSNVSNHLLTERPTLTPTLVPYTLAPTVRPTFAPSVSPTMRPSKTPTIAPSTQPTVYQSGPTEPPTERPTGPSSLPTSTPSVLTDWPSSCPTTTYPSSKPSTVPSSHPTKLPTFITKPPSLQPTIVPSSLRPSTSKPTVKLRLPLSKSPTIFPSALPLEEIVDIVVDKGGTFYNLPNNTINYLINTTQLVNITGVGPVQGNIYIVLPFVNGSLIIDIFNNITDKLDLSSHSDVHSMSDLAISSGSVIITFPTTGQRIRLGNLTPLDITENNFMFVTKTRNKRNSDTVTTVLSYIGYAIAGCFGLSIAYYLYNITHNKQNKTKHDDFLQQQNRTTIVLFTQTSDQFSDLLMSSENCFCTQSSENNEYEHSDTNSIYNINNSNDYDWPSGSDNSTNNSDYGIYRNSSSNSYINSNINSNNDSYIITNNNSINDCNNNSNNDSNNYDDNYSIKNSNNNSIGSEISSCIISDMHSSDFNCSSVVGSDFGSIGSFHGVLHSDFEIENEDDAIDGY